MSPSNTLPAGLVIFNVSTAFEDVMSNSYILSEPLSTPIKVVSLIEHNPCIIVPVNPVILIVLDVPDIFNGQPDQAYSFIVFP
jgi:hypothetical protein